MPTFCRMKTESVLLICILKEKCIYKRLLIIISNGAF